MWLCHTASNFTEPRTHAGMSVTFLHSLALTGTFRNYNEMRPRFTVSHPLRRRRYRVPKGRERESRASSPGPGAGSPAGGGGAAAEGPDAAHTRGSQLGRTTGEEVSGSRLLMNLDEAGQRGALRKSPERARRRCGSLVQNPVLVRCPTRHFEKRPFRVRGVQNTKRRRSQVVGGSCG